MPRRKDEDRGAQDPEATAPSHPADPEADEGDDTPDAPEGNPSAMAGRENTGE